MTEMERGQLKLCRIAFLEGSIEAIKLYAVWNNGEQFVGVLRKPLGAVLQPYQEEIDRLKAEIYERALTPECSHESVTRLPGITNGGVKISVCRNCGEQLEDHPE